jgi:hypothetical protein
MAAAAVLGGCCLAVTGCGTPDPLAAQTGKQILAEADADLEAAPSLTLYSDSIESGQDVTLFLGIVPGKGCTGTAMKGSLGAAGTYTFITKTSLSDIHSNLIDCTVIVPVTTAHVTKGQVTMLNGIRVLPLRYSGGVLYVTDTSKPEVVQGDGAPAAGMTDPAGETTWTIGAPVKLTPPPASQVISGAIIGM